ncbi:MAG: PD-(D/E)XK nuclease family protein [Actinomycetota bacterium]|nr:PD-(D/E)XK nuclease family protein [Actinomycetota bacterium]
MALDVRTERFGPPMIRALAEEIAGAQGEDPLRPVTVLVSRAAAGLVARRQLAAVPARTAPKGGHGGVVNVRFLPFSRFADALGEPLLVARGLLPGSEAIERSAARVVLRGARPEIFATAWGHPATARALAEAYRELRPISPASRRALASQGPRPQQMVALVGAMEAQLRERWFDEVDLAEAAAAAIEGDARGVLSSYGHVVAYLLRPPSPHHRRLLEVLARDWDLSLVLGATGVAEADEPARRFLDLLSPTGALEVAAGHTSVEWPPPVAGTAVVSTPSADAEVLVAVRKLMGHLVRGVPPERTAIAHGGGTRYPRLIREMLSRSGIEHYGSSAGPLAAAVSGRVLLGLFDVIANDWRRPDVIAWLASGPVRFEGRDVPTCDWDRISRRAGVVSGIDQWSERLTAYERSHPSSRDAGAAPSLLRFVTGLADRCSSGSRSWAEWSNLSRHLLRDLLGDVEGSDLWPQDELAAYESVLEVLTQLAVLDSLEDAPDATGFRAALALELERPAPQTSRVGRGVMVGTVAEIAGADLDVLFVVGMHEGAFPQQRSEDPLLTDRERAAAGPDLPQRQGNAANAQRDYLAALAAARERILSYSRGDQGARWEQRPARWVLDTLGVLANSARPFHFVDLEPLGSLRGFEVVPSFTAALKAAGEPVDLVDRDRRSLETWRDRFGRIDDHPLAQADRVLSAGLEVSRLRRSGSFHRFEGWVGPVGGRPPSLLESSPQSPTRLETYAQCPRRYFFGVLLGLEELEDPEDRLRMSRQDRGSLIHEILERWVRFAPAEDGSDAGSPQWLVDGIERITTIAEEEFAELERDGRTGRPALWAIDRSEILLLLRRFVKEDGRYRARTGAVPVELEMPFGRGGHDPVEVRLSAHKVIRFQGVVDRIDRIGDKLAVIDYKSGRRQKSASSQDPFERGERLQLPIYALAAQQRLGDVPVDAAYWFLELPGASDRHWLPVDPPLVRRLGEVVGILADGVDAGAYPPRPGAHVDHGFENCKWCAFDTICPATRERVWEQVSNHPAVVPYAGLVQGSEAGA